MATWPITLPSPQKSVNITPGDTRKERRLQSGRLEYRRLGDGKPDQVKVLFRLTWAEWAIFKEFYAHELNLGVNWFSADWLTSLGYDIYKARILGYPREIALQSYYVDVLCILIVQQTEFIVIEDTEWPCTHDDEPEEPIAATHGYIYGGISGSTYLEYCSKYDSITNSWASKTNMPAPKRAHFAASTIGSSGYVYAGYSPAYLQDCDEYTPQIKTWTSKTNMPAPGRRFPAASTIGSFGYIYGGYSPYLQDCDEYTPDTWVSKTNMPAPGRSQLTASTISSSGYIYGGYSPYLQDCDEYTPDTWASKTNMPLPKRAQFAASTIGSSGYVYGGYTPTYIQDCDEYTPDTWASKTNMPAPGRRQFASSALGSSGYVYGGYPSSIRDCDKYTPVVNSWASLTDMPSPGRHGLAASTI